MASTDSRVAGGGMPKPGGVIDNTFRVEERLGGGAAGDAFRVSLIRAWSAHSEGTSFCLKWYKDEVFKRESSENVIARRVREATVGSSVSHSTLVRVYDTSEFWHDGVPHYLLMDLVRGETLEEFAKRGGVSTTRVRELLLNVATGLKALHDERILHRDVKAANVMVTPEGRAILLDLGVVRPQSEITMTDAQAFLGTLRFAAPEWLFAEACDYKSDVYSLGTIAYHLLTGKEIFSEIRLFSRIVEAVRHGDSSLPPFDSDLPRQYVANLTKRMLKKLPTDRPNLAEVVETLADTERCRVWVGLHESKLFDRMPDYCRTDSEAQRSVVRAVRNTVPIDEFQEIIDRKDYDRLVRHKDVRSAIAPPKMADLISQYQSLPTESRVEWATQMYHTIGRDNRIESGAQTEGRWLLMNRLFEVEQSQTILISFALCGWRRKKK
jgi:serine/threonine protein kinase